jgi:hypothetical protein
VLSGNESGRITQWDIASGRQVSKIDAHFGLVRCMRYASLCHTLVVPSVHATVFASFGLTRSLTRILNTVSLSLSLLSG